MFNFYIYGAFASFLTCFLNDFVINKENYKETLEKFFEINKGSDIRKLTIIAYIGDIMAYTFISFFSWIGFIICFFIMVKNFKSREK